MTGQGKQKVQYIIKLSDLLLNFSVCFIFGFADRVVMGCRITLPLSVTSCASISPFFCSILEFLTFSVPVSSAI